MKLRYFIVLWSLLYVGCAHADIFKRIDANGHVTYSSTPLKGSKKLHLPPLSTTPPPARTSIRNNEGSADFPRVDSATQKNRDNTRRQILEDELATEEKALVDARKNLRDGAESIETSTGDDGKMYRNVAKQEAKMNSLQEQVQMHEKNITALKTELSNQN